MKLSPLLLAVAALIVTLVAIPAAADPNPPMNLMPLNGTTSVSLTPTLKWTWEAPVGCPEGIGITVFTVYVGTDPENLSPAAPCCNEGWPQPVGPLAPNTEYFWQVKVQDAFWDCPGSDIAWSVVQSFTTTTLPVPVKPTTWGRIKSLFTASRTSPRR